MIDRNDIQIRDPFVFRDNDEYYLFGTTDPDPWNCRGTGFNAWRLASRQEGSDGQCDGPSSDALRWWEGPYPVFTPPPGFWGTHDFWAPEVHSYRDRYYMFASFIGSGFRRGTQILVSDAALGPYAPLTGRAVTPGKWMCLDGTLFIDGDGTPWLVFCHEWVQVGDGQICAMRLAKDLTVTVGTPVLLFRGSDASWTVPRARRDGSGIIDARVTDGPFLHRQRDGRLVMLWSSLGRQGYAMGCAVSDTGAILGPWRQVSRPLVAVDGGHGMVFSKTDGTLCVAYHSPNRTPDERFRYIEVEESSDGLVASEELSVRFEATFRKEARHDD